MLALAVGQFSMSRCMICPQISIQARLSVSWRQRIHRLCSRCEIDDVFKRNMEKIFNCRLLSRKFGTRRIIERLIKAPGLIGEEIDDCTRISF